MHCSLLGALSNHHIVQQISCHQSACFSNSSLQLNSKFLFSHSYLLLVNLFSAVYIAWLSQFVFYTKFTFSLPSLGEAVGHLLCVLKQNSLLLSVRSEADRIVKSLWARPSVGGARVVATVLSNPAHFVEW